VEQRQGARRRRCNPLANAWGMTVGLCRQRKQRGFRSCLSTSTSSAMMSAKLVGLGPALRRNALLPRLATRNAIAIRSVVLRRGIQTEIVPPEKAQDLLNAQRVRRPSSPHFTIYEPQLTWVASIANRATGNGLSVLLYGFMISYLAAPLIGMPFSSLDVVELVGSLPESVKYAGKAILAAPFAFHSLNGLRHLAWDSGKFLSLKGAYASGYAVLGASAVATVALIFV